MRIYSELRKKTNIEGDINVYLKECNENENLIRDINKECLAKNELLGFILHFPVADGYAYYQITKVNTSKVYVNVCEGIGDDYREMLIGDKGWIDKKKANGLFEMAKFYTKYGN